jgi:hypothetical protein
MTIPVEVVQNAVDSAKSLIAHSNAVWFLGSSAVMLFMGSLFDMKFFRGLFYSASLFMFGLTMISLIDYIKPH